MLKLSGPLCCALACIGLIPSPGVAPTVGAWKYDLRQGDHLVYSEQWQREFSGRDSQSKSRAHFTSHVLVVASPPGRVIVGFQRNRDSAELLSYREKGKDKLSHEQPEFQKRTARQPRRFSEANSLSLTGAPSLPWQATREAQSRLLFAVHELEALPEKPVAVGDTWKGMNLLGFEFRLAGEESIGGKACSRVEGAAAGGERLRYWWCPKVGAIPRLEYEAEYQVFSGTVHENLTFELQDRRRDEGLKDWLSSPAVQLGALQALMLAPSLPVESEALLTALRSEDPETQSLALACLYQLRLPSPDAALVAALSQSSDPEVQRLADAVIPRAARTIPPELDRCPPENKPSYARQPVGTSVRFMQEAAYVGQPYMLHVPRDYRGDRPFPLLIYLSGGAGLAMDGVNTAEDVLGKSEYLVLYPQAGDLWWKPQITARFAALLNEVLHDLNVDTNRVYLAGFSNGGTGAMYYATLWPQRFAAVASLMGAGKCTPEIDAGLVNASQVPMLFVHGGKDALIPPACSTDTYNELQQLAGGTRREIHILESDEHDITLNHDQGLTLPFLATQIRNPFPKSLMLRLTDLTYPRRYWVEIVDKNKGNAEIKALITAGNVVEITARNVTRIRLLLRSELFTTSGAVRIVINKKEVFRGTLPGDCRLVGESIRSGADPFLAYSDVFEFDLRK
jgi:pimeloyl-ACP methyl ester carboxylesterase